MCQCEVSEESILVITLQDPPPKSVQTPIHREYFMGDRNKGLGSTFPTSQAQNTWTTCAISAKGKARIHRLRMPSVRKAKLDNIDHMCHQSQRQSQDIWTTCTIYWTYAQFGGRACKEGCGAPQTSSKVYLKNKKVFVTSHFYVLFHP